MKRRYTRRQIIESIKYWTERLHLMNENAVENQLYKKFKDIIYSTNYNYMLNINDLKFIQNILANLVFDKILECLPISLVTIDYMKSQSSIPFKGRIRHDYKIVNSSVIAVIPEQIQIVTFNGKDNLMKIVDTVAHELIHQYDYLYGSASILMPLDKNMELAGIKVKDPYDVHGKFFKYQIERINNEFDLNVEISYDETNMKTMKTMKKCNTAAIPIIDKTSLDESNENKNEKLELAKYLSRAFINDGSVSIEITDDGVSTWTI